jgi:hypothetical protein
MSSAVETAGRITARRVTVPSRRWYWVAAAIASLGLVFGVWVGVAGTIRTHDTAAALPRTAVPGTLEVAVAGGASRLIYFEGEGRPDPGTLGLMVTAPDGSPVTVERYDAILKYVIAGWAGTPIASFPTPVEGTYTVTADTPVTQGEISVAGNFARTQLFAVAAALCILLASFVCSLALIVFISVKRSGQTGSASR